MKPIKFDEANKELTKPSSMTDEECSSLHVLNDGQISVSCWQLSWKERFQVFWYGTVWLLVWGGQTQPPVCICAAKKEAIEDVRSYQFVFVPQKKKKF